MARGMTFAVVVATHGDETWQELARERAVPSAAAQGPDELIVVHDQAGGLARVRNRGARRARSTHLVFLDADDELAPGYLEAMRRAMVVLVSPPLEDSADRPRWRPRPSLLVPRVQRVAEDGTERAPEFPNRQAPMDELNHCVIGTAVPRLLFFAAGGFRADLPIYEDWALFLACERAGGRLVDVHGAIYRAHERPGSRNANRSVQRQVYRKIRDEHHEALRRGGGL